MALFKLGGKKRFAWTDTSRSDLLSIIGDSNETGRIDWSNVVTKFLQLHPSYTGKTDSLKKQYQRCKNTNPPNVSAIKENINQPFSWTDRAKRDLLSIVNARNHTLNWSHIATQFKQLYPLYQGDSDAVRMKYYRVSINQNEICEPLILTKNERIDLARLVNLINVDGYPNWTKIWYTFKRYHPEFTGSKDDLRKLYDKVYNEIEPCEATPDKPHWDENLDVMLAAAFGHAQNIRSAQVRDGRRKNIDNLSKITLRVFKEFFKARNGVEYIGSDSILLKHFFDYKELSIPCSYVYEGDIDTFGNVDFKKLQVYASKNHTLAFTRVFRECCHNCGIIFSRSRNPSQKLLSEAIKNFPQVECMGIHVEYLYVSDDKFMTCLECVKNPDWYDDYNVGISNTNNHTIPIELRSLNEYEQNQIALCGGFYTLHRKQNVECKIFEHRQGECNIGKKRDSDYHNLFTTYFNMKRPEKTELSNEKIRNALQWLRKNNPLFRDFLSNYETIYGYLMSCYKLHPEERILQISKGKLSDLVGKDTLGLFIPADNLPIENCVKPESQKFGVQHPLQGHLNNLRHIIEVNYSDPDLEAKRWPKLFPEGCGSWKRNSSLKQQTYVKHRLLSIDSRFRKNNEFMFFWYDRLIKERLLYFNNRQRTVNVADLKEALQAKAVRNSVDKYGSVVPTSISGSRTYWRARCLDLLALTRDLGKPDLFVTLTQNDNWFELQEVCGAISTQELETLDQPFMQPAIGGKSVVKFPVETVVSFFKRLDMFMHSCIHNKNGPFGEVIDYWFRIEYQNRGALHCHMVLWICQDTIPDDVVIAEMPRCNEINSDYKAKIFIAREYVKTFQMHTCSLGGCKKEIKSRCKYGFPYNIQSFEEMNESKMGFKYIRRNKEDENVVPYNIYALMCWNGHLNVQKVTANGIEAYLCKYVSKPERSIDIKDVTSETGKFLKSRIVGILECCSHLLQYHQVASSRKTIFLPCDFKPKHKMLKRKSHLPFDNESEDVYYQSLLHKYLVRPKELHNFTYVDMFRFYDVVSENAKPVYTQAMESNLSDSESEAEFKLKCDETRHEFKGRIRKIKAHRMSYVSSGYKYVERGKAAVPRWRFLMIFGSESEKYYEQRLLLNVPIIEAELNSDGYPFSEDNKSNTFVEECCLRGLVDSEETAKSALVGAIQRGFSVDRVLEIAKMFVDQSFATNEYVDSIILPWQESMPSVNESQDEIDNDYGEELAKMIEMRGKYDSYKIYLNSMTDSQKNVMDWVEKKLKKEDQILAIISGGAGVGKSYITKALYSYFVERKKVCILLATTGSAAHLISGTTVHFYLKIDIHGNKYLQPGSISAKIVEDTDVIILDEFSMLSSDLLDQLNECTKQYGTSEFANFGGKHVFLIGDPCQLPAINSSVFSNPILNVFSILLLKEAVRQKDESFAALLNRVRINMMTDEDKRVLHTRYTHASNIKCEDDMLIVTATRKKMQFYNLKFLSQIPGDEVIVIAQDFERDTNKEVSSTVKDKIRRYVKNLWDEKLVIKEGCIVRLLRNLDVSTGWVNSKRAKVFRVSKDGSYIILQDIHDPSKQLPLTKIRQPFKLGANLYYRYQYPLILGYSTTVHAVQGTTVTGKYYVDLDRSFWESGQAFVALSRPKEMAQLFLLNTHFEKVYLKSYYKDLLEWMTDVDEISLMRKPRCLGDFPLLPNENQNLAQSHVFPSLPFTKKDVPKKVCAPFKAPREKMNTSDQEIELLEESKNVVSNQTCMSEVSPIINPRIYRLAEAFNNSCRNCNITINKLRFGIKFLDLLLECLNDILSIHNIVDPLRYAEDGYTVNQAMVEKWDSQIKSTLNAFRRYVAQFRAEFEMFTELILSLNVCNFNGQRLANQVPPLYRDLQKWNPVHTEGDGRCFYHAVSVNLIGNSTLSNSLKILLSYEICKEFDIYDTIFSNLGSSASSLVLKALSYNCWADMEIITAMSYALQRPVSVISGLQDFNRVQDHNYNPLESARDAIIVAHVKMSEINAQPNHFVALLLDTSYMHVLETTENLNPPLESLEALTITIPDDDIEMESADSLTESL